MYLMELLRSNRSNRKFEQRPIGMDALEHIMLAQQFAACGKNKQCLRYQVVRSRDLCEELFEHVLWAARLPGGEASPSEDEQPAAYIVVLEDTSVGSTSAKTDAGLAMANLTLAARELGIGSCILGNIARAKIKEILAIEDHLSILYMVALGYPKDTIRIKEIAANESTAYYPEGINRLTVPRYRVEDVVSYK